MIGRSLGGFTIVRKLGAGGMGEVYLAEHRRIHRQVAIKILLPGLSADAELTARFITEARATSLIKHPGIVEVFDCDMVDDRVYLVMELLEGESLATALDRAGNFAAEATSVAAVVGQAADALSAAHDKGIIHRDLKPENIFLATGGAAGGARGGPQVTVKILDFGVAKLAAHIAGIGPSTQPGTIMGTPVYMSPEQCKGAAVDQRSDVYALGCIMFEMLTGRPPFLGDTPGDLLVAHLHEPPPAASSMQPGIPPAIDDLVARMLAKDLDARVGSMGELVARIEELLGAPVAAFATKVPAETRLAPPRARTVPPPAETAASPVEATQVIRTAPDGVEAPLEPAAAAAAARDEIKTSRWRAPVLPMDTRPLTPIPEGRGDQAAAGAGAGAGAAASASIAAVADSDGVPEAEPRGRAGGTRLMRSDTTFRHAASERLAPRAPSRPRVEIKRWPWPLRGWLVAAGSAAAVVVGGIALGLGSPPPRPAQPVVEEEAARPAPPPPPALPPPAPAPAPPPAPEQAVAEAPPAAEVEAEVEAEAEAAPAAQRPAEPTPRKAKRSRSKDVVKSTMKGTTKGITTAKPKDDPSAKFYLLGD